MMKTLFIAAAAAVAAAGGPGPCGQESCGAGCTLPSTYPPVPTLPASTLFPDPFTFWNGTAVATAADWACRAAEVSALMQAYELGTKPPKPAVLTGSVSATAVSVTAGDGNGGSISFQASVQLPPPGVGSAPYPVLLGVDGVFLNAQAISALGVALVTLNVDEIAQQNSAASRGIGLFYQLYGGGATAGALTAWAWAFSRVIDVIQDDTSSYVDAHGNAGPLLDVQHIGVTGCSRDGKGALVVGALDERIALTIPQESGSGGSASWRVSDWQGPTVQTLEEITGENVWFMAALAGYNNQSARLPFDHHLLMGLVAPRGLLVIENTGMVWLGNESTYFDALVGHTVYEALQVPGAMGYSQVGNHSHCQFPASQEPTVAAFVRKFLLGDAAANTTIMYTDGGFQFNRSQWINWTVPVLQ